MHSIRRWSVLLSLFSLSDIKAFNFKTITHVQKIVQRLDAFSKNYIALKFPGLKITPLFGINFRGEFFFNMGKISSLKENCVQRRHILCSSTFSRSSHRKKRTRIEIAQIAHEFMQNNNNDREDFIEKCDKKRIKFIQRLNQKRQKLMSNLDISVEKVLETITNDASLPIGLGRARVHALEWILAEMKKYHSPEGSTLKYYQLSDQHDELCVVAHVNPLMTRQDSLKKLCDLQTLNLNHQHDSLTILDLFKKELQWNYDFFIRAEGPIQLKFEQLDDRVSDAAQKCAEIFREKMKSIKIIQSSNDLIVAEEERDAFSLAFEAVLRHTHICMKGLYVLVANQFEKMFQINLTLKNLDTTLRVRQHVPARLKLGSYYQNARIQKKFEQKFSSLLDACFNQEFQFKSV